MSCGLDVEELEVLNFLYKSRCLASNRGEEENNFRDWFVHKARKNGFVKDFKSVIKNLKNDGYIAKIGGKKRPKYYISDLSKALFALRVHGYKVMPRKSKA